MPDNDLLVRTLFTDAAGDVPPGIDLLHGFRTRKAARRVRGRVALVATAAGGLLATALAVTLTIATAPSALAQLTSAASRTAGLSYDISAAIAATPVRAGSGAKLSGRITGAFDPARRTGEEKIGNAQIRLIGPYVYLYMPGHPVGGPAIPRGKPWARLPSPYWWAPVTAGQGLMVGAGVASLAETNPQNLLAIIKAASTVDRQGSASGPGWTGTSYAFTGKITFDGTGSSTLSVAATGTVGVDQQGRVRRFTAAYTQPAQGSTPAERVTVEMTFSDFGTPVRVSPPPASDVFIAANG